MYVFWDAWICHMSNHKTFDLFGDKKFKGHRDKHSQGLGDKRLQRPDGHWDRRDFSWRYGLKLEDFSWGHVSRHYDFYLKK